VWSGPRITMYVTSSGDTRTSVPHRWSWPHWRNSDRMWGAMANIGPSRQAWLRSFPWSDYHHVLFPFMVKVGH
jgi:hypothetical protein